ncbi:unnamed protein product [Closterium sp. NIES-54]
MFHYLLNPTAFSLSSPGSLHDHQPVCRAPLPVRPLTLPRPHGGFPPSRGAGALLFPCPPHAHAPSLPSPAQGCYMIINLCAEPLYQYDPSVFHGRGRYMIINLCSEPLYQYDPSVFHGRVGAFPIPEGQVPPLPIILNFCLTARAWLSASEDRRKPIVGGRVSEVGKVGQEGEGKAGEGKEKEEGEGEGKQEGEQGMKQGGEEEGKDKEEEQSGGGKELVNGSGEEDGEGKVEVARKQEGEDKGKGKEMVGGATGEVVDKADAGSVSGSGSVTNVAASGGNSEAAAATSASEASSSTEAIAHGSSSSGGGGAAHEGSSEQHENSPIEWSDRMLVIHSKEGLGRTGLMTASLLLFLNYYATAEEAINYFNAKRCTDGKALVLPSQKRYVKYFEEILRVRHGIIPPPRKCHIRGLRIHCCPYWVRPGIVVSDQSGVLFNSRKHPKTKDFMPDDMWHQSTQREGVVVFALPGERGLAPVEGDFCLKFIDRNGDFYCWLNTGMIPNRLVIPCEEFDNFDKRRLPSPGLQVEVILLDHDAPLPQPKKKTPAAAAATVSASSAKSAASGKGGATDAKGKGLASAASAAGSSSKSAPAAAPKASSGFSLAASFQSFMMGATAKPQATPQQQQQKAKQQAAASSSAPAGSRTVSAGGTGAAAATGGAAAGGAKYSLEGGSGNGKSRGVGGRRAEEEDDMHPDIFSDSDDDYDERGEEEKEEMGTGRGAGGPGRVGKERRESPPLIGLEEAPGVPSPAAGVAAGAGAAAALGRIGSPAGSGLSLTSLGTAAAAAAGATSSPAAAAGAGAAGMVGRAPSPLRGPSNPVTAGNQGVVTTSSPSFSPSPSPSLSAVAADPSALFMGSPLRNASGPGTQAGAGGVPGTGAGTGITGSSTAGSAAAAAGSASPAVKAVAATAAAVKPAVAAAGMGVGESKEKDLQFFGPSSDFAIAAASAADASVFSFGDDEDDLEDF